MKTRTVFLIIITFSFLLGSCLVRSIHPFYKESDVTFRQDLIGTWLDQDSSVWEFSQRKVSTKLMGPDEADNSYRVRLLDPAGKEKDSWFVVNLFILDGKSYLDFSPYTEENIGDNFASWHFIPSHSVARVEFFGEENAAFFWYDQEWLNELFEQNRVRISHEKMATDNSISDESYILTASTEELQRFLVKYGDEINIFELIERDSIASKKEKEEVFRVLEKEINEKMEKDALTGNDLIYVNMKKIDD